MLKEELETYLDTHGSDKVIKDEKIKTVLGDKFLDILPINTNKTLKQKFNLYFYELNSLPTCYCGNSLEFVSEAKASIYITKFGGWREYCCRKCMLSSSNIVDRRKQTCLERYGETSYAKTQQFKDDFSVSWSEEKKGAYNQKRKQTCLEKYNVEHFSKTDTYIKNRINTCIDRYGVENTFQLMDAVTAGKKTAFGNNIVSWTQTDRGREYFMTNNPMMNEDIKRAAVLTRFLRGYKNVDAQFVSVLYNNDKVGFINIIDQLYSEYKCKYQIADSLNISYSTLCRYIRNFDLQDRYISPNGVPSRGEREVYEFVKSFNFKVIQSDRTVLSGKELDIYVPDARIAIEYNGLYYHSEYSGNKDKTYHVEKTDLCEQQGIQLLHMFDSEWNDPVKREIWKSIISVKLGKIQTKVYARKTRVVEVSSKDAREFLECNHLSGFVGAKYHIGLYYNSELLSVLSIGESRFGNKDCYEIIRFASKLNTLVVGGLSKLLKYIRLDKPLITFADRRISSTLNSCYGKLFNTVEILSPSWYGFSTKDYVLNHRLSYTKQKMLERLKKYDESKSVFYNMIANGYDRIWDSGNLKFYNT